MMMSSVIGREQRGMIDSLMAEHACFKMHVISTMGSSWLGGGMILPFDWNAHYLLNAFSSQDPPRMGIVRYCTPAPALVGKKKKKRNYVKVQRRKVNMKGEHKVGLSWSSSSLSTAWASPSRFPSFFSESGYASRDFDSTSLALVHIFRLGRFAHTRIADSHSPLHVSPTPPPSRSTPQSPYLFLTRPAR